MFQHLTKTFKNYKAKYIKDDLIAGISVASISLPQAMAFSLIVGINPIFGVYTHIIATICASFLSISNYIIIGPTNLIAVAIASNLKLISPENYLQSVFMLTLMVGIIQLILGFLRVGDLVNYISHGVVIGLTTGVAFVIAAGQLENILGVSPENEYNTLTTIYSTFEKIDQANLYALALGLFTIIIILILNNLKINIPSYLVAVIIGIVSVKFFNFENQLEIIGEFSATFPRPHMIKINLVTMQKLLSSVFSIAILSFIQILSIIKVMEEKTDDYIDVNREFVNLGIINMTVSFFRGFVVTGSFSKSFANYESGAYSRLSGFFSGVSALVIILAFSSLIKSLPIATLAAIILVVAYNLIDFSEILTCFRTTRFDAAVFLSTFLMTIISPRLDYAVYFGVIVSIIFVLKRSSNIKSDYLTYNSSDDSFIRKKSKELKKEDYIVINLSGIMQFNVSDNLKEEFNNNEIEKDKYIIRMRDIEYIDITVIKELERFIDKIKGRDGEVYLSGVDKRTYEKLKEYGIITKIEEDHVFRAGEKIFSSTKDAIDEID
ncbi:MAG: SulP family inorganic anion transporter [Bacillota bacterium]